MEYQKITKVSKRLQQNNSSKIKENKLQMRVIKKYLKKDIYL